MREITIEEALAAFGEGPSEGAPEVNPMTAEDAGALLAGKSDKGDGK